MKKILLICTLLVLLTGCIAPRVYKENRFTKQFQEADSMFNEKYRLKMLKFMMAGENITYMNVINAIIIR